MSNAPVLTVVGAAGSGRSPSPALTFEGVEFVEIVAADRHSATLLRDFASSAFRAEIVPGPAWIVRFRRPAAGEAWVDELLALVERWLRSVPLPCAKVLHGGRSYLIRAANDVQWPAPAA